MLRAQVALMRPSRQVPEPTSRNQRQWIELHFSDGKFSLSFEFLQLQWQGGPPRQWLPEGQRSVIVLAWLVRAPQHSGQLVVGRGEG